VKEQVVSPAEILECLRSFQHWLFSLPYQAGYWVVAAIPVTAVAIFLGFRKNFKYKIKHRPLSFLGFHVEGELKEVLPRPELRMIGERGAYGIQGNPEVQVLLHIENTGNAEAKSFQCEIFLFPQVTLNQIAPEGPPQNRIYELRGGNNASKLFIEDPGRDLHSGEKRLFASFNLPDRNIAPFPISYRIRASGNFDYSGTIVINAQQLANG
jgi:hypothetical protein